MPFVLLAIGVTLLLIGGTLLVRGASGIARLYNVPTMIIGLTVVAFGTSTPELVVNITGALTGETDLAFGNAVGSNLANFGLVLGIAAIMSPIYLQGQVVRREVPFLLLVTAILMVMAWDQPLSGTQPLLDRGDAIILFLLFTVFVYFMIRDVIRERGDPVFVEAEQFPATDKVSGLATNSLLSLAGMIMLVFGGSMTIEQGSVIAEVMAVPEVVVGIFVVAVGTSLPELVTSIIATYRGQTDIAVGNVVGSNIFNLLFVMGLSSTTKAIPIPSSGFFDLLVMAFLSLLLLPFTITHQKRIVRWEGAVLLLIYLSYTAWITFSMGFAGRT